MKLGWGHQILSTPGPTPVPDETMNAIHAQAIDIYSDDAIDLTKRCVKRLKSLFRTEGEIFINASNGHGAWESALTNLFSRGQKILILDGGRFPGLWAQMAMKLGLEVEMLPCDWRQSVNASLLEKRLKNDPAGHIQGVLAVHVDTAASVRNDLSAIRAAMNNANHGALLIVDVVASLGTTDFEMDKWGIDVSIAASQKGLMMVPGLSFVAANQKALDIHRSAHLTTAYWDWSDRLGAEHYMFYCGTAPIQLLNGLDQSLKRIEDSGLDQIIARHKVISSAVQSAVEEWARGDVIEFNVIDSLDRSTSVTTVLVGLADAARDVRQYCLEHFNVVLGAGMGHLKHQSFRISHMGYFNPSSVLGVLCAVEASFKALGIPCGVGGASRAIELIGAAIASDFQGVRKNG